MSLDTTGSVPTGVLTTADDLARTLVGRRTVILTGAGISTDSGIPDYRGDGGDRRRTPPIIYRDFMQRPESRRRYWARSQAGFRHVGQAEPNGGHAAVATLQGLGVVASVITQNVDRLHQRAGARDVLDLHGRIDQVICTDCGDIRPRTELAERLAAVNPEYEATLDVVSTPFAPDGDADVAERLLRDFAIVDCLVCGGLLKPHVVFFGESMPRERRDSASSMLAAADGLLVLGSSLAVMSGYRLVLQAAKAGQPIAIVTRGTSRGDHLAGLRIDGSLSDVLGAVVARLT